MHSFKVGDSVSFPFKVIDERKAELFELTQCDWYICQLYGTIVSFHENGRYCTVVVSDYDGSDPENFNVLINTMKYENND